jgi:hypothetical protein
MRSMAPHHAFRSLFALHDGRRHQDEHVGKPAARDADNVAQRGALQRRDDPDAARHRRQRALARFVEQPFGRQLGLQLFERQRQLAVARRHQLANVQLIVARRLIDADVAASDDRLSIGRAKTKPHVFTPEHHAAQPAALVLQREIHVARRVMLEIRNLPRHRHVGQARVGDEALFDNRRHLSHRIHVGDRVAHPPGLSPATASASERAPLRRRSQTSVPKPAATPNATQSG